jgi:hypothetical protein
LFTLPSTRGARAANRHTTTLQGIKDKSLTKDKDLCREHIMEVLSASGTPANQEDIDRLRASQIMSMPSGSFDKMYASSRSIRNPFETKKSQQ